MIDNSYFNRSEKYETVCMLENGEKRLYDACVGEVWWKEKHPTEDIKTAYTAELFEYLGRGVLYSANGIVQSNITMDNPRNIDHFWVRK